MGAEWIDIKEMDSTGLHNASDGNHHRVGVQTAKMRITSSMLLSLDMWGNVEGTDIKAVRRS